jgi:glutamine---fructose-6-phosphate transaminase (isomerizing)
MEGVLERRDGIGEAARRHAPERRSWAVVGNGRNRIAAAEVRIKLSELCYKSIACDTTEDKKHIDLSSEPLILVCAAGLVGSNADDVAKEVEIYRAHKAAPVVVTDEGEHRFPAAVHVITVPAVHPELAFVLSAMAGHLFAYEAALAIDAQARPLREARAAVEMAAAAPAAGPLELEPIADRLRPPARRFFDGLRAGDYNGHLEAGTATQLASVLRYATGVAPLDAYALEHGKVGSPGVVLDDLVGALTAGIDQLTRPIDAIKHQAKTVTVGISRADETLLRVPLVRAVLVAGTGRDRLTYGALRTLAELDPAVAEVRGFTRYAIEGAVGDGTATIQVVDKGGVARTIPSRTQSNPVLRGTKHRVAAERLVAVERGRSDGRTLVLVPEVKGDHATGLTLLHVAFHDRLPAPVARAVLQGYHNRYAALKDVVTETEPAFADGLLADLPVADLLTEPVHLLADRWRARP